MIILLLLHWLYYYITIILLLAIDIILSQLSRLFAPFCPNRLVVCFCFLLSHFHFHFKTVFYFHSFLLFLFTFLCLFLYSHFYFEGILLTELERKFICIESGSINNSVHISYGKIPICEGQTGSHILWIECQNLRNKSASTQNFQEFNDFFSKRPLQIEKKNPKGFLLIRFAAKLRM